MQSNAVALCGLLLLGLDVMHVVDSAAGGAAAVKGAMAATVSRDYAGGFTPDGQCVHICSEVKRHTCFGDEPGYSECRRKGNVAGDWDYLLVEQLFLPQYCRLLEVGIDVTVSHQNVTMYPLGTQCIPERVSHTLTVHGLWPNYLQGFPGCCNNRPDSSPFNRPLDPLDYAAIFSSGGLSPEALDSRWRDPAIPDPHSSLCNIFNHEWQKHGHCLGKWNDPANITHMAAQYFEYALKVISMVDDATAQINAWSAEGTSPSVEDIRGLYPRRIELWCALEDADGASLNRLMAVRTCWNSSQAEWEAVEAMDCSTERPYGSFALCDTARPVVLQPYARALTDVDSSRPSDIPAVEALPGRADMASSANLSRMPTWAWVSAVAAICCSCLSILR